MFRTGQAVLKATVAMSAGAPLAARDVFDLDPIRVAAKEAQATLGNRVIGTGQIGERNTETMAGVFNGEPAIITSGGTSIPQKIMVQGIEESLLSVTIDGARQNKSAFHRTGHVLMDPTLLKQAEVTSGLAPADTGPGALAGSIAYEIKDARDFLEPGDPFGGQAALSYGDNAQDFRRSLTLAGQSGGFEWLLSGTRLTGDDYADGDGNVVRGTGADLTSVLAKIVYTTETGKRFQSSAEEVRDEGVRAMQMSPGRLGYARPAFEGVVGRPSVYREAPSGRRSYNFFYTDEAPQGIFAPTVQLSYKEHHVETGATVGTNASLSGKVENVFDIGKGALTAGIDFFHDTATGKGVLNTGSPEETLDNIGICAQIRQDVTEQAPLSYGARIVSQRFEPAGSQSFRETGVSLSGQADGILSDAWTLNIGLPSSRGGYELSEASLVNLGGPWFYGTPEPSRANNARIGLRYDSGPWAVRGALFYTEIKNVNDLLSAARSLAMPTSKGFDGSVAYFATNGYMRMNHTYADVTLDGTPIGSTAYIHGRPVGHMIALERAYALSPQRVVGGNAEISLENNDTAAALPGYEVVNLFAAYSPPGYELVELRLDARNIFDETYAARGSDGIDLPSRIVALNEPGRTVSLTASHKY